MTACYWLYHISLNVTKQNINNLKHIYIGSLLPKPCSICSMKEYKYIYILVLICQVSVCHAQAQGDLATFLAKCRNLCVWTCERTWDNGRKKCCEGRGEISQDLDIYCKNGLCDCGPGCVSAMYIYLCFTN